MSAKVKALITAAAALLVFAAVTAIVYAIVFSPRRAIARKMDLELPDGAEIVRSAQRFEQLDIGYAYEIRISPEDQPYVLWSLQRFYGGEEVTFDNDDVVKAGGFPYKRGWYDPEGYEFVWGGKMLDGRSFRATGSTRALMAKAPDGSYRLFIDF